MALLHLRGVTCPPNGYHQWRESDSAAIILNYYQQDFSFLLPRINQRGDGSGITGIELPVYQYTWWIVACLLVFIPIGAHTASHDYYSLPIVLPMAVLTGIGFADIYRRGKRLRAVLIILMLAAPIVATVRTAHRIAPAPEFAPIRQLTETYIPRQSHVAVQEQTTAIRLYQLNRHGWPLRGEITADRLRAPISSKEAAFVTLEKPATAYNSAIVHLLDSSPVSSSPMFVYHVRK